MNASRDELERELESAWRDVKAVVDLVPDAEKERPGVVEEWSVKDLLGHMAFWADKAARDLKALVADRPDDIETPSSDDEERAWNAREAEARKGNSLAQVRAEWERSHRAAAEALQATPMEALEMEVKGWPQLRRFLGDTTWHYRQHAEHIKAWARETETSEA